MLKQLFKTTLVRLGVVLLVSWIVVMAVMALHIAFIQIVPLSWWFSDGEIKVINVDTTPSVMISRTIRHPVEATVIAELYDRANPDQAVCTNTYIVIDEPEINVEPVPLQKLLPNCDFAPWFGRPLFARLHYNFDLDYGIHRFMTLTSPAFVLRHPRAREL